MPSLIPAEVMAQVMRQQGIPQTVNTGAGQTMPGFGMDNSMPLQNAHAQAVQKSRGQTSTPQTGPGNRGPMSASVYKSMLIDQAGLNDNEKHDYQTMAQDTGTTPQMLQQALKMRQQQPQQHNFAGQPQPNQMTVKTKDQTAPETGSFKLPPEYTGMQGHSLFAKQAHTNTYQGAQPPQDPVVQMANSFKGKVPDELWSAGTAALNAGAKPEQVFGHFQQAMQHQQQMNMQQQHQQMQAHQHQMDQITKAHPEIDFQGDESQFTGNDPDTMQRKALFNQVKGQQGGQQQASAPAPQAVARNPKTGETLHFINGQWTPAK